jgi:oligopeptidase A
MDTKSETTTETAANPFLNRVARIPFDHFTAEQIEPAIDELLQRGYAELAAIAAPCATRTFENTLRALDDLGLHLSYAMGIVSHLESVATTPQWRATYNRVIPRVTEFSSKVRLDPGLWQALQEFATTKEAKTLAPHRARLLTKTIEEFRRNGADLPPAQKQELSTLNTELAECTNRFAQNTLDATNAFEFYTENENDLAGLPASALAMGAAAAKAKGRTGWRFTLQAPSYLAIMTYADSRALREQFYRASNARCATSAPDGTAAFSNVELLYRILELRHRKATMLGYRDFSDLVLADRMAKDGARAQSFVDHLRSQVADAAQREHAELCEFVRTRCAVDPGELAPWDIPYYAEKLRQALYDFDEEELRPYFPLPTVLKGMFTIVERVLGVSVRPCTDLPTWCPEVTTYSAFDATSGELLGHFYVDLFPRENKRSGAWMNHFIMKITSPHDPLPHVGLIAGNFTPPQGSSPALLTHDEVTTLFHECGHLLHQLCSRTELRSQSMEGVAWDFIELPSQIMENWCWEREALHLFSGHVESGAPLPDDLFEKMVRARNFRVGSFLMRQLSFSTVDLALHRHYQRDRDGEILEYCRAIAQQHSPVELRPDFGQIASFGHLFASSVGYAAGYYSYQWAEVLDADAFSRFMREGIMNRTTGLEFRDTILGRGDTAEPDQLFSDFMGRPPELSALLRRCGLLGTT